MLNNHTSNRKNGSTKPDPLAPYQKKARTFVNLYFNSSTPDYVKDVMSSWFMQLEQRVQMLWEDKQVIEVILPKMLREAERRGIETESPGSELCLGALRDSVAVHKPHDEAMNALPTVETDEAFRTVETTKYKPVADLLEQLKRNNATPQIILDAIGHVFTELRNRYTPNAQSFLDFLHWQSLLARADEDGLRMFKQGGEVETTKEGNAPVDRARELVTTVLVDRDESRTAALIELLTIFGDEDISCSGKKGVAARGVEHAFTYSLKFDRQLDEYLQTLKAEGYGCHSELEAEGITNNQGIAG